MVYTPSFTRWSFWCDLISGRGLAVVGLVQTVSELVASSVYNSIYPLTLKFWPGFCWFLGAIVHALGSLMVWYVAFQLYYRMTTKEISLLELNDHSGT